MPITLTTLEGEVTLPYTLTTSGEQPPLKSPDKRSHCSKEDDLKKIVTRLRQQKHVADHAADEVTNIARKVEADQVTVDDGLKQASLVEQNLEEERKLIKGSAFTVCVVDEEGKWIEHPDPSVEATDVGIHIEDQLVSEEKANFAVEVARTIMVMNQVLKPEVSGWKRLFETWSVGSDRDRRSRYIRVLKGICHVGLEHEDPSQLALAKKSLDSFREEFVANEAGTVKNKYLWRLGLTCLAMSVIASLSYVYARSLHDPSKTLYDFRNFFILVAGASVGTWLSFSLRRVIITFLDLAVLEEDRLDPVLRVLFITALTSIVGLLIWSGAVSLSIGSFNTTKFANSGSSALLIGLLLGIAERTMATGVQNSAIGFGASMGGK